MSLYDIQMGLCCSGCSLCDLQKKSTYTKITPMNILKFFAFVIFWGFANLSQAATITRFSPQGATSGVRQIVIDFDRAAVTFGEAKLPAPVAVQCSLDGAAEGSGRWLNERSWAYDFATEVPAGVVCSAELKPLGSGFLGGSIQGDAKYLFNTGGPVI